eukprot:Rhum_TRINITY_DN2114_c0_g1::Rhum_TRINITY_DN2114_c0_g1_i1::g.6007::m.6007/K20131/RABGEF1; Rab5 GDP/GTP exchange factor
MSSEPAVAGREGALLLEAALRSDDVLQDMLLGLKMQLEGKPWLLGFDRAWTAPGDITLEGLRGNVWVPSTDAAAAAATPATQPPASQTPSLLPGFLDPSPQKAAPLPPVHFETLDGCKGVWDKEAGTVTVESSSADGGGGGSSSLKYAASAYANDGANTLQTVVHGTSVEVALVAYVKTSDDASATLPPPAAAAVPAAAAAEVGDPLGMSTSSMAVPASESGSAASVAGKEPRYKQFIAKMRDPRATPLGRSTKRYISQVAADAEKAEEAGTEAKRAFQETLPASVSDFLKVIFKELKDNELWSGTAEEELAQEGMEKYLLCKLHQHTFGKSERAAAQDATLSSKLEAQPCPAAFRTSVETHQHQWWEKAVEHLAMVNTYKAPLDKLTCIRNCCRIACHISGGVVGPDNTLLPQTLPHLVHAARVQNLFANVEYIQQYRGNTCVSAEDAGYLSLLSDALDAWVEYSPVAGDISAAVDETSKTVSLVAVVPPDACGKPSSLPLTAVHALMTQVAALRTLEAALSVISEETKSDS